MGKKRPAKKILRGDGVGLPPALKKAVQRIADKNGEYGADLASEILFAVADLLKRPSRRQAT